MKDKVYTIMSAIAGILIIISVILGAVNLMCFDRSFYKAEYEKLGTAASIGMSQEDLDKTTEVLLDYIQDRRSNLDVTAEINGETRQVFNQREIEHMVDVKNLYLGAMNAGMVCGGVGLLVLVVSFVLKKKQQALKGYLWGNAAFVAIFAILAIYAAVDFNSFWNGFHHIFFTNDLWILNPATDILIMMVPQQFFFDLVMRIVIASVVAIAVLLAADILWLKGMKRRELRSKS